MKFNEPNKNDNINCIEIKNLSKIYEKKEVLKNINLTIKSGEIFGLLGPNGAGKSTLLSIIASVLKASSGEILINGFKPERKEYRSLIGFVPQEIALYQKLSAKDNLSFWADILSVKDKKKRINEILSLINLLDVANKPVYKYSTGMKRRLNLGVSLIHDPQIIIMDEPTVGIDLASKQIILEKILELKSQGKSFIFTTHNADEPNKICDRVGIIKDGEILYTGTSQEVLKASGKNNLEELMA